MRNLEGESDHGPLRPLFDRRLKLEFHGSRVTSDAGLLAYRELDDALGLTALAGGVLADSRTGRNSWHGIVSLLRQSVYGRLAGYEDVNDADRLGRDPAMRWIVGGKAVERGAASTSQMGRFETELLANNENLAALADLSGMWIDRVHDHDPPRRVVLDMDSSVSPTFGEQEGTAYNGHFGCTCYHPLFVFNQFGDLERCALRPGNVHSAHGWRDVLVPVVERYKERAIRLYFRGDAAFSSPEIYDYLEAEGMLYAIRLPANKVLQESIAHLLKRPVGRLPKGVRRYHASFSYQAGTWDKPRRVVSKIEWHPGELYPRVGFIVTNLSRPAERVIAFYNQRGTAEQWIKEGKNAIRWTRLSCRRFFESWPDDLAGADEFVPHGHYVDALGKTGQPDAVRRVGDDVDRMEDDPVGGSHDLDPENAVFGKSQHRGRDPVRAHPARGEPQLGRQTFAGLERRVFRRHLDAKRPGRRRPHPRDEPNRSGEHFSGDQPRAPAPPLSRSRPRVRRPRRR